MKIELPLGESPLQCYPDYGTFFGIVDAYTKNYLDWIYNYFIQLVVSDNNHFRLDFSPPRILKALPWLDVEKIDRELVRDIGGTYCGFVMKSLDHGKYIYALMDTAYTYRKGKKGHSLHEHLIYGYDDEKGEFYFCDNYVHGKYARGIIHFDDLENANKSVSENNLIDWYNGIMMLSYIKLYDYGNYMFSSEHRHIYDERFAVELMKDYLYERNTECRWVPPTVLSSPDDGLKMKKYWGIGVYQYAIKYLEYAGNMGINLEIRGFYALLEHKKIVKDMIMNKFKSIVPQTGELCGKSVKTAEIMTALCVKYNLTKKTDILKRIQLNLEELRENDIQIFSCLLNERSHTGNYV